MPPYCNIGGFILIIMSSAFVKEGEEQKLNEVAPNLSALQFYLRRENSGIPVHQLKSWYSDKYARDVYEMSDGLIYARDADSKWFIILHL
jgi:hypothetical protein